MPLINDLSSFSSFPERIVSLVPSMSESLFDLGMGEHLVGVTEYCIYPLEARALLKVGGTKDVQVNEVLRLSPDLVIANQEENSKEIIEELAERVNVWLTFPKTVRQVLNDLCSWCIYSGRKGRFYLFERWKQLSNMPKTGCLTCSLCECLSLSGRAKPQQGFAGG